MSTAAFLPSKVIRRTLRLPPAKPDEESHLRTFFFFFYKVRRNSPSAFTRSYSWSQSRGDGFLTRTRKRAHTKTSLVLYRIIIDVAFLCEKKRISTFKERVYSVSASFLGTVRQAREKTTAVNRSRSRSTHRGTPLLGNKSIGVGAVRETLFFIAPPTWIVFQQRRALSDPVPRASYLKRLNRVKSSPDSLTNTDRCSSDILTTLDVSGPPPLRCVRASNGALALGELTLSPCVSTRSFHLLLSAASRHPENVRQLRCQSALGSAVCSKAESAPRGLRETFQAGALNQCS